MDRTAAMRQPFRRALLSLAVVLGLDPRIEWCGALDLSCLTQTDGAILRSSPRMAQRRRMPENENTLHQIAKNPSQAQNNHDEAPNDG
ncbi:hypothetical protein D3C80_1517850 [compost metagenome]